MEVTTSLDSTVSQFDLNKHPFYSDWARGVLPVEKLSDYSAQLAPFVGTIALGWDALGEWELGAEERTHEDLWAVFRRELKPTDSLKPAPAHLASSAVSLFGAGEPEAIGALWAFEAQQPNTSRTKLDGLNAHYQLSDSAKKYFEVHADDLREIELLRAKSQQLTPEELVRANMACASICAAMWKALDAVYYQA